MKANGPKIKGNDPNQYFIKLNDPCKKFNMWSNKKDFYGFFFAYINSYIDQPVKEIFILLGITKVMPARNVSVPSV